MKLSAPLHHRLAPGQHLALLGELTVEVLVQHGELLGQQDGARGDPHALETAFGGFQLGLFLRQFLPEDEPWAEKLKARIERKERIVGDHFAAIEPAQEQALKNIFNTPLKGKLGYMMIETSIKIGRAHV